MGILQKREGNNCFAFGKVKRMTKKYWSRMAALLAMGAVVLADMLFLPNTAYAATTDIKMNGNVYQFDGESNYQIGGADKTSNVSAIGTLKVLGSAEKDGKEGNFEKINVSDGNIEISYSLDKTMLTSEEDKWHLISDGTDKINDVELSDDIEEGAILVQTSLDGNTWIDSKEVTNCFSKESKEAIYTSTEIQLLNGCYYRITVAYKEERTVGSKKIIVVNKDEKEQRKIAEVYEFYAVNEKAKANEASSPEKEPRQEYDDKSLVVNAGKDTGYSETEQLTGKDVHYGWSIGTFTVNGYTQTQEDEEGNTVFLKNVGDQITLWFTLNQDINKLNGKDSLVINDDKNGYDLNFQTGKTDMGRGTLIIQYTDSENSKHDPVIYTDYLAACSTTSADTRVALYEEGDYEIALDYEIKSTPRKVGPVEVVPDYYNYRTYFKFSVHNSNAMLYPFDLATGSELQNMAVTPNGFRIDLANSKDLKVDVTQSVITVNSSGKHVEDSRGTKAARDGSEYTKEGKYTVEVNNTYTKKSTTKTIFVGSDPFLVAMANTGYSAQELDGLLAQGYTIGDDGSLNASTGTETSNTKSSSASDERNANTSETVENDGRPFPIVPAAIIVVLVVIIRAKKKKSSRRAIKKDRHSTDSARSNISRQDDSIDAGQYVGDEMPAGNRTNRNNRGGEKQ